MRISNLTRIGRWPRALLDWLCGDREDYRAFQRRRRTRAYRVRLGWCKVLWIGSGVAVIVHPYLPFVVAIALATSFLCFAILDESD
ncbi:MAG: hypothetical protein PVF91_04835 [Chromatiales bacterium]|jgi:hypothetical protein